MAGFEDDETDLVESEDYYAVLGLNRNATREEVNNAFRHYSKLYHPDKHQSLERKQKAVNLFNKIKQAHEVLSDPHQRAIYDAAGIKGLQTEGWQLQTRHKTPQEIMEEYERLRIENEEKRLQQRTNPKGSIRVGVDATDIFDRYEQDYDSVDVYTFPNVEINSMEITQSVECPLTTKETVILSGSLSSRNGTGQGDLTATIKKILNHSMWGEAEVTFGSTSAFALRAFRTLWSRGQAGVICSFQLSDGVVRPIYSLTFAHQLDKHLQGRLNFSGGIMSGVTAMAIYDREGHQAVVGCQIGIPSSFIMLRYSYVFQSIETKVKTAFRFGTSGVSLEYGCEKKITSFSHLGATMTVGVPLGVSIKIKLSRGSQTFEFPIRLSESIVPAAVFYGTVFPLVTYFLVKKFIVNPYIKDQTEKDLKEKKGKHAELFARRKQEAASAMELMTESIDKSYEIERNKNGLIIVGALYGKNVDDVSCCIEVSRCLQALIKNSKLVITENTKLYDLPGFYDPCFGEPKVLFVEYDFNDRRHQCHFNEQEKIVLPNADHLVR